MNIEYDEAFKDDFYWLSDALRIIASDADYQQQQMGGTSSGVAWELREEILTRLNSILDNHSNRLTSEEIVDLSNLLELINKYLKHNLTVDGYQEVPDMLDKSWNTLRIASIELISKHKERFKSILLACNMEVEWLRDIG